MDKKLFGLLIALMSLSLVGIIFVQSYWISNSYNNKESQFISNVRQALINSSAEIELNETERYFDLYSDILSEKGDVQNVSISELIYKINSEDGNDAYIFSDGIMEEDYKLSSGILNSDLDSLIYKKITSKKKATKISKNIDGSGTQEIKTETFSRLKPYERAQFESFFANTSTSEPIHRRVSSEEIEEVILDELGVRGVNARFQFAVYSNNLATKVRSKKFEIAPESTFKVPLFDNNDLNKEYQLYVNFYEKDKYVLSSVLGMTILSLTFTSVIFITFYSAISQIFKQRQLAQIKNDFINNMTHEFKTPIATINLALDALKNPKVKGNQDFFTRYMGMIRDENNRMHEQVENVLRISKLEKNELDLPKEKYDLHDIIEDSISHISLIVEDSGGDINTHFGALKRDVLVNESHMINVFVNILENAVKYSEHLPKIDVFTENTNNEVVLKIRDQGVGMSKNEQKKIFEKFYRVSTGDIHNVKGHGLGLSYVKRILDDHDAKITVDSEQGKGSTFTIKLHLIS
ncbi:sensor histidine kinase [Patiriisocius sp. Uisw_017]|jgi:two-component system phosphate regulon sensor histidine kinase PhoR|uniref:sensor histidine kinase n=1 Tax=Patiriisocius sp. Uisw_017 TaxID=3230968 RepID=UPI0039E78957